MPTDTLGATVAEFNRQVEGFGKTVLPEELILFQKKIAFDALRGIVTKTPVDTGRARGNWQTTIGSPPESELDVTDANGGSTISKGIGALSALPPYEAVWIVNNVPYILALEDGHSKQAPEGMVEQTIERLKAVFP